MRGNRRPWVIAIASASAAVVVLIAATAVVAWLLLRPAPTRQAAAPASTAFSFDGDLTLVQGEFIWDDPTCSGWKGYDDIRAGTEVVVSDAAGKSLVVGSLKAGAATVGSDGRATECTMKFHIDGVPSGVGPYGVAIGSRGVAHYSWGDLLLGIHMGFD